MFDEEVYRENISKRYLELSESNDKDLQDIVSLASEICNTPIALITLLDRKKQYFKAKTGIEVNGTERKVAFCNYTIKQDNLFVVKDAIKDDRFKDSPLVTDTLKLRFYAGYPLRSPLGINVGSLCVIDHVPRQLTPLQEKCLEILSRQVIQRLELGVSLQILEDNLADLKKQKEIIDQSKVLLRAFFDAPDEYQILLNKELEIVAVNRAAKEMFWQYRHTELKVGDPFIISLTEQTAADFKVLAPIVLEGTTVQDERLIKNNQGEELWVKFTLSPALDNNKEVIGIALVGTDINTRKKQEEKIQNQYKSLSQIAQWQSHRLRQPVSSILALTNLIKEDNCNFREEYLHSLETVTKQLDTVIQEIVRESRSV